MAEAFDSKSNQCGFESHPCYLLNISTEEIFMKTFSEFIAEAASRSLSRLHGHIQAGHMVGFISAHRGNLSPAENNKRTKQLKASLKQHGYTPVPVKGEYVEDHNGEKKKVKEKTFMIHSGQTPVRASDPSAHHNMFLKVLKKHGEQFGQDTVLSVSKKHGSVFHGTGKSDWVPKGKRARIGGAGISTNVGDFNTTLKRKKFIVGGGS
jgi:hypothetical protein